MPYRVWDNGVIRDATQAEIEEMRRIPPPIQDPTEYTYRETDEAISKDVGDEFKDDD